ncbi:uncharacterized protein LOC110114878 isoform X2 [Dendrobium catenatum]|uniref:uncharacterized protein LOC110114878 isoform X2 n=1 Tax=Dendrobium catenatum TaxID=906689 RepID=UPI0009F3A02C|nr:uncharacterized protein LOC110114878 isoform X2 [Dendrobium catenatum]
MGGGGGSSGNGVIAAPGIPSGARKMVQSLKEIVNLPDQEIYFTLKECGMDPSEAVQRLLSQDSFHEVKSKRDKKKEVKELSESRTRTNNNTFSQGVLGSSDCGPRPSFTQSSLNGFGVNRGKALQKKEDGVCSVPSSSNVGARSDINKKSTIISENVSTESLFGGTGIAGGSSLHSQPSSGYQHGWTGIPGRFSMADIVKMGRPQGKLPMTSTSAGNASNVSHQFTSDTSKPGVKHSVTHDLPSELDQGVHSSQGLHQQAQVINYEPGTISNNHVSHDSWPAANQSHPGTTSNILETFGSAISYADTSKTAFVDEVQVHQTLRDESPEPEKSAESDTSSEEFSRSETISEGEIDEHNFEGEDTNVEISSAAANLQNLSIEKVGLAGSTVEDNPAVIIPRHLQITNADCSHLCFGSFGSGVSTSLPRSLQPKPLHNSSEVITVDDVRPLDHSNARNSSYYDNAELKSQINEDVLSRVSMNAMNYEISAASEAEVIRDDAMNSTRELQYNLPSLSDYGTSTSTQESDAAFEHPQTNLQMHNLSSLSNMMPYTSSLSSSLLAPTMPIKDVEIPFSSLLTTPSAPTKHSVATSNGGTTVPLQEVKPNAFSDHQSQAPQSSPNTSITTGHAVPQHLPLHPYSQATLPLAPFANMISYPFLPQSYTYLPSAAFPQAYTTNDPFHQSPAAAHNTALKYTLPQNKSSISVASLPQPAAVASGYGSFSGSTNIPVNFSLNPSSTPTSTTLGFSEALSSQYKEVAHYLSLQQNESSPMWVHGGISRTVSPLPPNTFYGFQGQNQHSSFRQAQQPSHYGQMGYLNFFQNQLGGQSQEQQLNSNEVNLNGSQGNPSQQSHQLWQHGY